MRILYNHNPNWLLFILEAYKRAVTVSCLLGTQERPLAFSTFSRRSLERSVGRAVFCLSQLPPVSSVKDELYDDDKKQKQNNCIHLLCTQ